MMNLKKHQSVYAAVMGDGSVRVQPKTFSYNDFLLAVLVIVEDVNDTFLVKKDRVGDAYLIVKEPIENELVLSREQADEVIFQNIERLKGARS